MLVEGAVVLAGVAGVTIWWRIRSKDRIEVDSEQNTTAVEVFQELSCSGYH